MAKEKRNFVIKQLNFAKEALVKGSEVGSLSG